MKLMDISTRVYCGLVKIAQDNDWDFLTQDDPNNALHDVNEKAKSFGAGAYSLAKTLAIASIVIAFLCAAAVLGLTKNRNSRTENKEWLVWLCGAGVIVFGIGGIMTLLASIGGGL